MVIYMDVTLALLAKTDPKKISTISGMLKQLPDGSKYIVQHQEGEIYKRILNRKSE